jgi:Tol biopolymer transport system component
VTLAAGTHLHSYEIRSPLGAGGMGEVYLALDTRLQREVAIKVLPDSFLADSTHRARFDREAHLLAALNHPNIASVYGFEELGNSRFLVLELVLGETLAERLAAGPLPAREVLVVMRQIAEALEAAHEQGIIHRDLKPANVKVTPAGRVKVLDFGLAKMIAGESPSADLSLSPTASGEGTRQGVILGTAAYMSPEQARGKPVDERTDVWSFGAVFYEALTGRKAFGGETMSDMIAVILEREPDWGALPASVPQKIRDLVRRCLQKDRDRRLHDIADARIEIDEALAEPWELPAAAVGAVEASRRRLPVGVLATVAVASALVGALVAWLSLAPRRASATGPVLASVEPLTHDPGITEWPTWSPDGSLLAFASNRSGDFDIYVRRVEGGQEVNVTSDPGQDYQPAFSPDGNSVAFVSTRSSKSGMIKIGSTFGFEFRKYGGDVWVAPALGGRARRLAPDGNFPVWHPDGKRVAYVSGQESHRSILEVTADGGAPKTVLSSDASNWEILRIQYSPGGRWLDFETLDGEVYLVPATGGTPRLLFQGFRGSNVVWEGSGRRLYFLILESSGGTRLQSVEIDEASGRLRGQPQTVGLMTGILRDLAVSRDGEKLVASELEGSLNLTRLPLTPDGASASGPEEELSSGRVIDRYPHYSPDGRRIAFASDRLGAEEIWMLDLETRRSERLELTGQDLGASIAIWSPDGKRLAVTRFFPDATQSIWIAAADGSQSEEAVPPALGVFGRPFSPDGTRLLYNARTDGLSQLFVLDLATRKTRQLTRSTGDKQVAVWSPDGRWIAYSSNATGSMQLWRMPAEGGEAQMLTSGAERMYHPIYSPDGRWIYVQPSHRNIYRLPAAGGPLEPVTKFPDAGLFLEEPTLSPDGRWLAYCRSNGGSSLWLLTIGGQPAPNPN